MRFWKTSPGLRGLFMGAFLLPFFAHAMPEAFRYCLQVLMNQHLDADGFVLPPGGPLVHIVTGIESMGADFARVDPRVDGYVAKPESESGAQKISFRISGGEVLATKVGRVVTDFSFHDAFGDEDPIFGKYEVQYRGGFAVSGEKQERAAEKARDNLRDAEIELRAALNALTIPPMLFAVVDDFNSRRGERFSSKRRRDVCERQFEGPKVKVGSVEEFIAAFRKSPVDGYCFLLRQNTGLRQFVEFDVSSRLGTVSLWTKTKGGRVTAVLQFVQSSKPKEEWRLQAVDVKVENKPVEVSVRIDFNEPLSLAAASERFRKRMVENQQDHAVDWIDSDDPKRLARMNAQMQASSAKKYTRFSDSSFDGVGYRAVLEIPLGPVPGLTHRFLLAAEPECQQLVINKLRYTIVSQEAGDVYLRMDNGTPLHGRYYPLEIPDEKHGYLKMLVYELRLPLPPSGVVERN